MQVRMSRQTDSTRILKRFSTTSPIIQKVFGANSSFHVKQFTAEKV